MLELEEALRDKRKWPEKIWGEVQNSKIPLSIRIHDDDWIEVIKGKAPDYTLAHLLAGSFILWSLKIPSRVKDEIVIAKPLRIRNSLNQWNKEVAHDGKFYPYGDLRHREPMMAIASAAIYGYLNFDNSFEELEKLARVIYDNAVHVGFTNKVSELLER